jgi:hypothetical protein
MLNISATRSATRTSCPPKAPAPAASAPISMASVNKLAAAALCNQFCRRTVTGITSMASMSPAASGIRKR